MSEILTVAVHQSFLTVLAAGLLALGMSLMVKQVKDQLRGSRVVVRQNHSLRKQVRHCSSHRGKNYES